MAMEAVRMVAPTENLDLQTHALMSLVEVLQLADRRADAATAVRSALELYRQKVNLVAETRGASLLEELGS
jgi:hypothetical protein